MLCPRDHRWVRIIALAGLDAVTGNVMLLYLSPAYQRRARERRLQTQEELRESFIDGAALRLRPKLMTVANLLLGLGPALLSDRTGADLMKRSAAPMLGGLVTSFCWSSRSILRCSRRGKVARLPPSAARGRSLFEQGLLSRRASFAGIDSVLDAGGVWEPIALARAVLSRLVPLRPYPQEIS